MDSKTLRKKFLDFFERNDHVIIPSAPLVPSEEEQLAGKEKVLFTSAGMQQLIPYLMGKPHPKGKKLADVQKCVRTDDIEEVGDAIHHTFFEMLGNWSLGDYWKEGAIELSFKFLTEELKIPLEKLAISVFAGDDDVPKDEESAKKWKELGIPEKRIAYLGKEANWWPTPRKDITTGELKNAFGPCGPDTEMFIWTGLDPVPEEFDPKDIRWVEVWNDVFMEFKRKEDGTLEELPQKNVDTGMGLERMLAVLNGKYNDYETDLFEPIIADLRKYGKKYSEKSERIIADHLRAAMFLMAARIKPDPKDNRGSVVRRLLTNALTQENKTLGVEHIIPIMEIIVEKYGDVYPELNKNRDFIEQELKNTLILLEGIKNSHEIVNMREIFRTEDSHKAGRLAYFYHQSHGIPENIIHTEALSLVDNYEEFKKGYDEEFRKHQQVSKVEKGIFKGGLAGHSEIEIKYHTATHLLHQALRDILGPQVFQQGSNITAERLRFDFSYDKKMTDEEIKKVEEIINKKIKEDLKVDHMIVSLDEAKKMNAIGLFDEKYADKVSLYGVGPDRGGYYSLEFCGGPHVDTTGVIGKIKITKEEAISSGIRRIRAVVE